MRTKGPRAPPPPSPARAPGPTGHIWNSLQPPPERGGEEGGASRGPRRCLSPPPSVPGPEPRDAVPARPAAPAPADAVPGTQTPEPLRPGQGPRPAQPGECAGLGEGRRDGPGFPKSRIAAGEPGQGLGAHQGAHAPPVLLLHGGSGHCAPSPRLQAAPIASAANPQTELPAFPGGRKLAPKRRRIRALSARDWEAERCGPGPGRGWFGECV